MMVTELLLDCGHAAKRIGDVSSRRRMLCAQCSAAISEQTQRQLSRGSV